MATKKNASKILDTMIQELTDSLQKKSAEIEELSSEGGNFDSKIRLKIRQKETEVEEIGMRLGILMKAKEIGSTIDQYLPQISALLGFGQLKLNEIQPDFVNLIKGIAEFMLKSSNDLESISDQYAASMAKSFKRSFDALTKIGFSDDQAMQIVLARTKPLDLTALQSNFNNSAQRLPRSRSSY